MAISLTILPQLVLAGHQGVADMSGFLDIGLESLSDGNIVDTGIVFNEVPALIDMSLTDPSISTDTIEVSNVTLIYNIGNFYTGGSHKGQLRIRVNGSNFSTLTGLGADLSNTTQNVTLTGIDNIQDIKNLTCGFTTEHPETEITEVKVTFDILVGGKVTLQEPTESEDEDAINYTAGKIWITKGKVII